MRLRPDQLADNLQRKGLQRVYFLTGDEPLQMLEAADLIRREARRQGCEERTVLELDRSFDWDLLSQVSANLSLFASRRIIELRMGKIKPGRAGADALVAYLAARDNEDVLLITAERVDRNTQQGRWFKALDAAGVVCQIWPVEPGRLPLWIKQRMQAYGRKMDSDAASLIAERVEGNLLAARQEIDKLVLLVDKDTVDLQDVMEAVADSSRFEVFDLVACSLSGNTERMLRMLRGLRSEGAEPLGIFGALMWEMRQVCSIAHEVASGVPLDAAFQRLRIWEARQVPIRHILKRYSDKQLQRLLRQAGVVDKSLKGAIDANGWEVLENYLFRIAGVRLQSLPVH